MRFSRDRIAAIALLGLGGLLLALTEGLPKPALVPIGPAFYPRIVISVLIGLSALLLVQDHLAARRAAVRAEAAWPALGPVVGAFAVVALYIMLLPQLGFRLATLLFVIGFQCLLAPPRRPGDWLRIALVAVATAALTWFVFEHQLSVLLPRGRWTGW